MNSFNYHRVQIGVTLVLHEFDVHMHSVYVFHTRIEILIFTKLRKALTRSKYTKQRTHSWLVQHPRMLDNVRVNSQSCHALAMVFEVRFWVDGY